MNEGASSARDGSAIDLRRVGVFGLVGSAAFATHYSVVLVLVPLGLQALVSNIVGFLCAFALSYVGHGTWTFPPTVHRDRRRALHRFLGVAVLGFVVNELLFWAFLRWTDLPYQIALIVVLTIVAGETLLLSKHWAFADE